MYYLFLILGLGSIYYIGKLGYNFLREEDVDGNFNKDYHSK